MTWNWTIFVDIFELPGCKSSQLPCTAFSKQHQAVALFACRINPARQTNSMIGKHFNHRTVKENLQLDFFIRLQFQGRSMEKKILEVK